MLNPNREQHTLELLSKFKNKLETLKEKHDSENEDDSSNSSLSTKKSHKSLSKKKSSHRNQHNDDYDDIQGDDWLAHKLCFEEAGNILAKDASTKKDDWYDVYDPRNPINKRKRDGAAGGSEKHKKSSK